jgi:hypothetical protein
MDSFPDAATVQAQLVSVSEGLVQGPQLWWASSDSADTQVKRYPQAREAESAACPGLLRPDPWR